jgi:hypothetical protein
MKKRVCFQTVQEEIGTGIGTVGRGLVFLLLIATFAVLPQLSRANSTGVVYEQDSKRQKELYRYQLEESAADGLDTVKTTFKDLEGQTVFEETAVLKGTEILKDEVEQRQTGQKALVEVKDGKIYFSKTANGKTTVKDEKLKPPFVMSSTFRRFVASQWPEISKGKTVSIRYGVWDRQETVGFEIFKIGEEKIGDQQAVVLKLKPSSFIIAALVSPVIFKFSSDGSKLLEMNGRVAPKKKVGTDFKDLDAEVVYSY